MWTTRNIALLGAGGALIAAVAFFAGRRVEPTSTASAGGMPEVRSGPSDASAAPAAPVASAPSASASSEVAAPMMPLGDPSATADLFTRLQAERDTRLKLEPTTDSVFAAMRKLGVQIEEQTQVAGFIVGAKFCDKVRTKNDNHVVVCEFADEAAAIKGVSNAENKAIKSREVLRNKTTTCAVHVTDEKAGAAEAAKIKERFKAL